MAEIFNQNSQENAPGQEPSKQERLEALNNLFDEAEKMLETEAREIAKEFLPQIYNELLALNGRDKEDDWTNLWIWNPEGILTKEEFDDLNLRRKLLSNAIGIENNGVIRHDLNEI